VKGIPKMKLTSKMIEKMIIQEYNELIATAQNPDEVRNGVETHAFASHMEAIQSSLKQIEEVIRKNEGLNRETLVYFKTKAIEDIYSGIRFLEGAIDSRLNEVP
jgi:hypothetical protein